MELFHLHVQEGLHFAKRRLPFKGNFQRDDSRVATDRTALQLQLESER